VKNKCLKKYHQICKAYYYLTYIIGHSVGQKNFFFNFQFFHTFHVDNFRNFIIPKFVSEEVSPNNSNIPFFVLISSEKIELSITTEAINVSPENFQEHDFKK